MCNYNVSVEETKNKMFIGSKYTWLLDNLISTTIPQSGYGHASTSI